MNSKSGKVRLIRVTDKDQIYRVDAEDFIKILGIRVWKRNRVFQKHKEKGDWVELPQEKIPSRSKQKQLDFWISNHEKFVAG